MLVDAAGDGTPHRAVLAPEFGQRTDAAPYSATRCCLRWLRCPVPHVHGSPHRAAPQQDTLLPSSHHTIVPAASLCTRHWAQTRGLCKPVERRLRWEYIPISWMPPARPVNRARRDSTHSYTLYRTDARTRTTHHAQPELRAQRPANTIASIRTDECRDTPVPRSPGAARVSTQVRVAAPAAQCTDGCSCAAAHAHAAGSAHAPDARGAGLGTGRRSKWAVSCLRTAAKAPVSAGVQDPRRPAPSIPKMGIAALLRVDDRAAAAGDG
jgi:hypothetical protein